MLIVLSPAKRLTEGSLDPTLPHSQPALLDQAALLARTTRRLSRRKLKELMGISDKLAELNHGRFQALTTGSAPQAGRQAVRMFAGDVYVGLDAASLSADDLAFAQERIAILSGLYGLLRPLDQIEPHRLEMGTRLATRRGPDLYAFWGDRITDELKRRLEGHADPTLVNLASHEYFSAVRPERLAAAVITPRFLEVRDGKARVLAFYAKKARGRMARWAIERRVEHAEALKGFDHDGYRFDPGASDEHTWTFHRPQPPPAR